MKPRLRWLSAALLVLPLLVGCSSATPAPKTGGELSAVRPAPIEDARFAQQLAELLRDGAKTDEARSIQLGVVRAQLRHAKARFEQGADERALASVLGALYLLRAGDDPLGAVDAETLGAIDGAIARLSKRGDDGRARVLLSLRARASRAEERAEIEAHIAAIDRFAAETRTGKAIERLGDAQRSAVRRAMLDPSAIDEAVRSTSDWIDVAIEHNVAFRQTGRRPSPEEATEVARALDAGATTIAALSLRYADLEGAVGRIEASSARRIIDPDLYAQLVQARGRDDAAAWRQVFGAIDEHTEGRVGGELGIDKELLDAANLGITIEAFRREPTHLPTVVELSRSLTAHGMGEAVPILLDGALGDKPTAAEVGAALQLLSMALDADADAGDTSGASRTIAAANALLEHARDVSGEERSRRAVAELRYKMATILVRGGHLPEARPLLVAALAEAPTAQGHLLLAHLTRHEGTPKDALDEVQRALSARGADPLDLCDAHLLAFEIQRDEGRSDAARASLDSALDAATKALEGRQSSGQRARALRTLGRVLRYYGDAAAARRVFARALDEMRGDRRLVGTTMLAAASSALAHGDTEAARLAVTRGRDAGAPQEDLVYAALWLWLAEKRAGARPDGTAADILDAALGQPTWVGRLSAWARGRLDDGALVAAAYSEATRVEAAFYVAMASGKTEGLDAIAKSPVLDLLEVQIARELLAPKTVRPLPKGTKLP